MIKTFNQLLDEYGVNKNIPDSLIERYSSLIMPVDTGISLDSVILSDENKAKIQSYLDEYKAKDKLISFGLRPMNRILMYGASGTGKTYLSKALSNYLNLPIIYVDIGSSLDSGDISSNIADLFEASKLFKGCILFFDECDALAWSRDSAATGGDKARKATNSLFQHLDQMSYDNLFIGATNMLHRLDPAFERRFDMKMEFRKPDKDLLEVFNKFMFTGFKIIDNVDSAARTVVKNRNKLSYYELQIITERAMKRAVIDNKFDNKEKVYIITTSQLYDDLARVLKIKFKFNTNNDNEGSEIYNTMQEN